MNKVLFIVGNELYKEFFGSSIFSIRNLNSIYNYFGKANVDVYSIQNKSSSLQKNIDRLYFRLSYLTKIHEKEILDKIDKYTFVFIDASSYGKLAKSIKLKNPQIKIAVFFQNVEYDYAILEKKYFIQRFLISKIAFKNELWTCKYSDTIIALNSRDARRIEKLYKRKVDKIIPISLQNRQIEFSREKIGGHLTALFVGSNFFANISGISWFIEKVLPFVSIKLKIVGKNMDKANLPKNEKMEIFGYIENLDRCIQDADFMISPIFKGSGMKVKTCEALMHGKNIIGTHEAFEGYDMDFEKVGACCETANEFIEAINEFPKRFTHKFNEYSRKVFLEKYTDEIVFKQFAEVFEL